MMAQVMKPDAPEPSFFQTAVEVAIFHVVRVHEIAVCGAENPLSPDYAKTVVRC